MLIGHQPKDFLLAVEALTVSFDGFKAVNDLSFYVDDNEIRVIIGPNGAGKTTVLDLICGKTKATSGSIQFRGKELTRLKENQIVQAGIGRKFQTPSIYEDLTVFENLEISFPRGRTVVGALGWNRSPRRRPQAMSTRPMSPVARSGTHADSPARSGCRIWLLTMSVPAAPVHQPAAACGNADRLGSVNSMTMYSFAASVVVIVAPATREK